jgi:transposase
MGYRTTTKQNKGRRQQFKGYTVGELETLPLLYPDLAGIDIGSREHYVSVPGDRSKHPVRTFGCTTPDLLEMVNWLKLCGITQVVMESTGVYWVPVAMMLEDAGLKVALVDARESHRLSARKTDVHDCQWIRQLYACGLLRNAFRPSAQILLLRSYWRQRQELVSMCATSLHHMQKALELMNVQLHKVISDIAGLTGMRILRAIVAGQRDPDSFAHMVHPNCKSSSAEFVDALTGHYAQEQVFALGQALRRYDLYQEQIAELDRELHRCLQEIAPTENCEPQVATAGPKSPDGKRRKNQSHFNLAGEVHRITGVDLTRIEGIDALTAFTVITEQGIDMGPFPTEKHFASHLGLCPNNQITGGRVRNKRTRRVQSRAAHALRLAAQSLARSKTALGAFYRRMRARHGAAKANVATAHKLAKIVYRMLRHGEQYVARGQAEYEKRYRERLLKNLKRQAKILGCEVLVLDTGQLLS